MSSKIRVGESVCVCAPHGMCTTRQLVASLLAVAIAGGTEVATANAALPLVARDRGQVTLDQLAGGRTFLSPTRKVSSKTYAFMLPREAKQGPKTWYLIQVDARVVFAPGSNGGSVLLSGATNGRAAAQIEFASRSRKGKQVTTWSGVDYIRGSIGGRYKGNSAEVHYRNYLQLKGAKPGRNTITLEAEHFDDPRVEQIELRPTTGVYATPAGPVELEVSADAADESVEIGEPVQVEVVAATGTSRPTPVEITASPRSEALFTEGPVAKRLDKVRETGTATFSVGRTRPGSLELLVTAVAPNGSEASIPFEVEVGRQDGSSLWKWLVVLVAAGLGGTLIYRRAWGRRHA